MFSSISVLSRRQRSCSRCAAKARLKTTASWPTSSSRTASASDISTWRSASVKSQVPSGTKVSPAIRAPQLAAYRQAAAAVFCGHTESVPTTYHVHALRASRSIRIAGNS
jgi:hypothetical protein